MSWIQKLQETYDNCESMVGVESASNNVPLLPICHTTQKAHVEIVIDGKGNFRRARAVPKDEARTIIPCTESSSGRTSGESPHPLCDKLQYVAADYLKCGGNKKHYHTSYVAQLEKWCNSSFVHPKTIAVLKYVKKGSVIEDLIEHQILIAEKGKLIKTWEGDKKSKPFVLSLFQNQEWQADAFVRWIIESDDLETKTWKDKALWNCWINYYVDIKKNKTALCYVSGKETIVADQHPKKVRNDGDGAKLIASGKSTDKKGKEKVDDGCGFTFLGRFLSADQALGVSLAASQKSHIALRWLIGLQGYGRDDLAIVSWATSGVPVPKITDSTLALLDAGDLVSDQTPKTFTAQNVAIKFKKRIAGYGKELGDTTNIVVMGVDSATPGRLAIIYYRELTGSEFLKRVDNWHESCAWLHHYGYIESQDESGKSKRKYIPFIGAPAPNDIAEVAYGKRLDDKLRKTTISRILPCIIDGQPMPRDLVESVVRRASNRVGIKDPKDKRENEWNKTLTIACALFRKFKQGKENYNMTLDPDRKTRDYLYGRLLALADSLEEWALNESKENRSTNAARLMQRFAERPYSTWRTIELALTPYKIRLGGKSKKRQRMIDDVIASFSGKDFTQDKPLSGEFLLGYHCQRESLHPSNTEDDSSGDDEVADTTDTTNS